MAVNITRFVLNFMQKELWQMVPLTLASLGKTTHIETILFVSCHSRKPTQVFVAVAVCWNPAKIIKRHQFQMSSLKKIKTLRIRRYSHGNHKATSGHSCTRVFDIDFNISKANSYNISNTWKVQSKSNKSIKNCHVGIQYHPAYMGTAISMVRMWPGPNVIKLFCS